MLLTRGAKLETEAGLGHIASQLLQIVNRCDAVRQTVKRIRSNARRKYARTRRNSLADFNVSLWNGTSISIAFQ